MLHSLRIFLGGHRSNLHCRAAGEGVAVDDAAAELLVDEVHHHDAKPGVSLCLITAGGKQIVIVNKVIHVLGGAKGRAAIVVAAGFAGVVEHKIFFLDLRRTWQRVCTIELIDGVEYLPFLIVVRTGIVILNIDRDLAFGFDPLSVVIPVLVAVVPLREIRPRVAVKAACSGSTHVHPGHQDDLAPCLPQRRTGHPVLRSHEGVREGCLRPAVKAIGVIGSILIENIYQRQSALIFVAAVDLQRHDHGFGGVLIQIRNDGIQHGAEGLVFGSVVVVGRMADKVAMHHDHIVSVPSCAQIQRADAGVELLFNEIFLAGHFVVAGVPAALHVGGGGIVGAGDVEFREIAAVRQQAHPVGVFIRFAHVVCRVPVQHLDPPAEGEFALLQITALLRPGCFSRPAVLFGILEVVPRHDVEIGISVFQEKGLGIAVPVLLQIEPLRERPVFEVPDVHVAAGL